MSRETRPDTADIDPAAAPRQAPLLPSPVGLARFPLRQQRFICEYLACGKVTVAAQRAGYSERYARDKAYRFLRRPDVQALIAAERQQLRLANNVTLERVISELARLAFADPRDLFTPEGRLKPIHELDEMSAAGIAAFEVTTVASGARSAAGKAARALTEAGGELVIETRKVKSWDKLKALELLGRYLGLFKDKVELGVSADLASAIEAARKRSRGGEENGAEARVVEGTVIEDESL